MVRLNIGELQRLVYGVNGESNDKNWYEKNDACRGNT